MADFETPVRAIQRDVAQRIEAEIAKANAAGKDLAVQIAVPSPGESFNYSINVQFVQLPAGAAGPGLPGKWTIYHCATPLVAPPPS